MYIYIQNTDVDLMHIIAYASEHNLPTMVFNSIVIINFFPRKMKKKCKINIKIHFNKLKMVKIQPL